MQRRTIDCRMFGDRAGTVISGPGGWRISPDGQLIAIAMRPGVCIARASDGAALAFLPIGFCDEAQFLPEGSLLTYNERGICRWPVRPLAGNHLRMGPPEPLARFNQRTGLIYEGLTTSSSGRLIGVGPPLISVPCSLDPEQPWRRTCSHRTSGGRSGDQPGWPLGRHREPRNVCGHLQVKVGTRSPAGLLVQLPLGNARVAFSPDCRWLGVGGTARYRFFRTGSWTPGPADRPWRRGVEMRAGLSSRAAGLSAVLDSSLSIVRIVDLGERSMFWPLNAP